MYILYLCLLISTTSELQIILRLGRVCLHRIGTVAVAGRGGVDLLKFDLAVQDAVFPRLIGEANALRFQIAAWPARLRSAAPDTGKRRLLISGTTV